MNEQFVEAIEEGKIVTVSESYAKSEGLPIIRKSRTEELKKKATNLTPGNPQEREFKRPNLGMSQMQKNWKQKQVTSELVDNFHWQIRIERKRRGLTRKQLSKMLNEREENLKMLESGFLPSSDFILINKIQQTLGVNLRKDQKDFTKDLGQMMKETTIPEKSAWVSSREIKQKKEIPKRGFNQKQNEDFSGNEIEIFDDEI